MSIKNTQIQEQLQQQKLGQTFSQQQLLQSSLIELPVAQLVDRINTEMNDNPALETESPYDDDTIATEETDFGGGSDAEGAEDFETATEREERQSALDEALSGLGRDDEDLPVYQSGSSYSEDREEMVYGESESFYDQLKEQVGEMELTDKERDIIEYLIGSLDDDGLLRKDLSIVSDELAIYHNIDASEKEIEHVLLILQAFDPAGIGARSLQECLLLQIERRDPSKLRDLMERVVNDYFEAFTRKHWDRIQEDLKLNDTQAEALFHELRKLNPRPGASLSETIGRNTQQVTPDFVVESDEDGNLSFTLTKGRVPDLYVSRDFQEMIEAYRQNPTSMTRRDKEALVYAQQKMSRAQLYIEAVRQRQRTMSITMKALLKRQRAYFLSGDDSDLKPMVLKDVAEDTGFDISTISRVCNSKYVDTPWGGTIQLRSLFSHSFNTESGEEVSTREVKNVLRELIEGEPADKPLSDFKLATEMSKRGYPIARRTVAKYREQMGIPISSLRK